MNDVILSVDPGLKGGLSIFKKGNHQPQVYKMPIIKASKKTGKVKNTYDWDTILSLLKPFSGQHVIFVIEQQNVRP